MLMLLLLLSVVCCFVNEIHWHYYCVAIVHSRLSSFTDKIQQKHIVLETKYRKKIKHSLRLTFVLYCDDMEKKTHSFSVLLVWWVILLSAIHFVLFYHSLEFFLLKLMFNQAVHVSATWSLCLMIKTQITLIIRIFMGPIYRKRSFK